ncbi:MAG: carbon storage regulator [Planctomycetota bacterium]
MIVLSQKVDDAIVLGGTLVVVVTAVTPQTVSLSAWGTLEHAYGLISRVARLARDESVQLADQVIVSIVDIREEKVRLGLVAPREVSVNRWEVGRDGHREP